MRHAVLVLAWCTLVSSAWAKTPGRPMTPSKPGAGPIPIADANKTPWGKTVDGLACRLLALPDYCIGQPVSAVIEIKNVSKRTRHLIHIFNIDYIRRARMKIIGPDGRPLRQSGSAQCTVGKNSILPIEPGEAVSLELPDLGSYFNRYDRKEKLFESRFSKPGKYTLTYTLKVAKFPKRMVVGERFEDGKRVKLYHEFPDEVMKAAWSGTIASNTASFNLAPLEKDDLRVHEWGVFTVFTDRKLANLDRKAEWESLPDFFYRQFPTQRLRWAPAAWNKPIIHFYSRRPSMKVNVKVTFAEGAPVVWWPCCEQPVDSGIHQPKPNPTFRSLLWSGWLGRTIPVTGHGVPKRNEGWRETEDFPLPEKCWVTQARLKDAMPFTVAGSKLQRGAPWASTRPETERFIFYDGLAPSPDYLRCVAVGEESVTLKNTAKFAIGPLFLVDNRGGAVRFARIKEFEAGKRLKIAPAAVLGKWPASGSVTVQNALVAAGLYEAEARALLKIWTKGFFERPGVTAFYILPRAEYDRMIKLEVNPRPKEIVRVGIALHPHLEFEPQAAKKVAELIKKLDDPDWRTREDATKALLGLGPLAARMVEQALKTTKSAEVKVRCEQILKQVDATDYLRKAVPPTGGMKKT